MTHPHKLGRDQGIAKLGELISDVEVAMLTTVMSDGSLRSRPMANQQIAFDGNLWFFTDQHSHKILEIQQNPHVNVSYVDHGRGHYVSVCGTASVVQDETRARLLWHPIHKSWLNMEFGDPNLILIRVHCHQAEYWDAPANRMVELFARIKAAATGVPYEPGRAEDVDLELESPKPKGEDLPKSEGSNIVRATRSPGGRTPSQS